MKIKVFGWNQNISSVIPIMEEEFKKLGCEIGDNPDLIMDFTGFFDDAIEYGKKYPKAKKIFNLLNADVNNPNWPEQKAREQYLQCDIPTTVSESTRKDILSRTGIDTQVIYWPMKSITNLNYMKSLDFAYVGRLYSQEKRFNLVVETLKLLKYPISSLILVGPESFPQAYNVGLVPEPILNEVYNSTKYLFCPCWREGSMSMLESCLGNCIPIVCNDNYWVHEFGLTDFAADPHPVAMAEKIIEIDKNLVMYRNKLQSIVPNIIEKFDKTNVAKRIIDLYATLN